MSEIPQSFLVEIRHALADIQVDVKLLQRGQLQQRTVNRRFIATFVIDAIVTVVSIFAAVTANSALHDTRQQVVTECERSNAERAEHIDLWADTIRANDPANNPAATAEEIQAWEDSTEARDAFFADLTERFEAAEC